MTLKLRILISLTSLFIILVRLTRALFSEEMLVSNRCIRGLMSNLIKKSWTDSILEALLGFSFRQRMWLRGSSNQSWEAQRQGFIKQSILKPVKYILNENYSLKVSVCSSNCKFCNIYKTGT